MVRLDCDDPLVNYYEKLGFSLVAKNEKGNLNQMMTLIR